MYAKKESLRLSDYNNLRNSKCLRMQVQVWLLGGANYFSDVFHVVNMVLIDLDLKSGAVKDGECIIKIKFQLSICTFQHLICWCVWTVYIQTSFFSGRKHFHPPALNPNSLQLDGNQYFFLFFHWHTLDNYSCFDRTSIFYYVPTHSKPGKQISE